MTRKKFFHRYLPLTLAVLLLAAGGLLIWFLRHNAVPAEAGWYGSGWGYRKAITIDHNKVSGIASSTINSFPLLISVTDSDLKYTGSGGKVASSTAGDILFTDSTGTTKLDFEIESYASTTGALVAWVRIPILSAVTDTTIYIYFGNASATNQQNPTAVWNSNYKAVWHMSASSTTFSVLDSTSNSNHLGIDWPGYQFADTGQIDGGIYFKGSNGSYLTGPTTLNVSTGYVTVSAWYKATSSSDNVILAKTYDGSSVPFYLQPDTAGAARGIAFYDGFWHNSGVVTNANDSVWHYIAGTYDGSTLKYYLDGVLNSSSNYTGSIPSSNTANVYINSYVANTGKSQWEDEVRIADTGRSSDWIKTEYNNQSSPSTFYSYGSLGVQNRTGAGSALNNRGASGLGWYPPVGGAAWSYRKQITIDHNKVSGVASSTINSFPVLINVTDSDLKYTGSGGKMASSTGGDILFTAADGTTKLDFELEKYSSTTGETIAWVRIPILSAVTDTTIYIFFGNASATDQSNKTGVWDSNYKLVYHLNQNAANTTVTDSTGNGNNGTSANNTSAMATSTNIGGGFAFNGTSDNVHLPAIGSMSDYTVTFWVKNLNNTGYNLDNISNRLIIYPVDAWSDGKMGYFSASDSFSAVGTGGLTTGVMRNLQYVFDGTNTTMTGYHAGSVFGSKAHVSETVFNSNLAYLGAEWYGGGSFATAVMDEFRVSNIARSADWIATEYNNQNSPSTFYSYGALSVNGRQDSSGGAAPAIKSRGGVKFR